MLTHADTEQECSAAVGILHIDAERRRDAYDRRCISMENQNFIIVYICIVIKIKIIMHTSIFIEYKKAKFLLW